MVSYRNSTKITNKLHKLSLKPQSIFKLYIVNTKSGNFNRHIICWFVIVEQIISLGGSGYEGQAVKPDNKEDDAAGGEQRKKIFMALLLCSRAFMKYHEFVSYLFHIHTHDVNISRQ